MSSLHPAHQLLMPLRDRDKSGIPPSPQPAHTGAKVRNCSISEIFGNFKMNLNDQNVKKYQHYNKGINVSDSMQHNNNYCYLFPIQAKWNFLLINWTSPFLF